MFTSVIKKTIHQLESSNLNRTVELEMYIPEQLLGNETLHLLLLNDGQDAAAMNMEALLAEQYASRKIDAVLVVAIKASANRSQEYGVAGVPDFKQRGAMATAYTLFITDELIPFLHTQLNRRIDGKTAFAGFSLGGLSAFDIAYNHPEFFDLAGVFSGAFWWRSKDLNDGYIEELDRITHEMVRSSEVKPELKFWLMTGTKDETADRNKNHIIDSIDDTIDLIKELENKGFKRPEEIFYYEAVGGKHDVQTWAQAFPAFLSWAFPLAIKGRL
ncbi:alpha/beta hydrolase [Pedobacter immunditicola]|uniref:alpha/beta hydrolase n=1 Tax=Pedobacter immunditicola TaxID=3133440 RepID=UPI0030AE79FD